MWNPCFFNITFSICHVDLISNFSFNCLHNNFICDLIKYTAGYRAPQDRKLHFDLLFHGFPPTIMKLRKGNMVGSPSFIPLIHLSHFRHWIFKLTGDDAFDKSCINYLEEGTHPLPSVHCVIYYTLHYIFVVCYLIPFYFKLKCWGVCIITVHSLPPYIMIRSSLWIHPSANGYLTMTSHIKSKQHPQQNKQWKALMLLHTGHTSIPLPLSHVG